MNETSGVRVSWLRFVYWYTVVGAGAAGLWVLLSPRTFSTALGMPVQDPFILGVVGSAWLAFAGAAVPALRSPLRFAPMLLVQLGYKTVWFVGVLLAQALRGPLPFYAWLLAAVFASYIVLDLVAIPFRRLSDH